MNCCFVIQKGMPEHHTSRRLVLFILCWSQQPDVSTEKAACHTSVLSPSLSPWMVTMSLWNIKGKWGFQNGLEVSGGVWDLWYWEILPLIKNDLQGIGWPYISIDANHAGVIMNRALFVLWEWPDLDNKLYVHSTLIPYFSWKLSKWQRSD